MFDQDWHTFFTGFICGAIALTFAMVLLAEIVIRRDEQGKS
jgi:hypothetical protein